MPRGNANANARVPRAPAGVVMSNVHMNGIKFASQSASSVKTSMTMNGVCIKIRGSREGAGTVKVGNYTLEVENGCVVSCSVATELNQTAQRSGVL